MLLGNDGAFESLGTLTAAFLDQNENADGIADVHFGQFFLHVLLAENFDQIHIMILPSYRRSYRRDIASAADRLSIRRAALRTSHSSLT